MDGQYVQTYISYQLTVAPKEISIDFATAETKTYDGNTEATVTAVTFDGVPDRG